MNVMTNALNKMTAMTYKVDEKLKKMGKEPYGVKKLTETEQRDMYKNLTGEKLGKLIQEHGLAKVNEWLYDMEVKYG